jgi:hypothetical protein
MFTSSGIDIDLKFKMPWSLYITAIFGYFIGKFLLTCGTGQILALFDQTSTDLCSGTSKPVEDRELLRN